MHRQKKNDQSPSLNDVTEVGPPLLTGNLTGNLKQTLNAELYQSNIQTGESPFLLNGTIKEHLATSKQCHPESAAHIEEIKESFMLMI